MIAIYKENKAPFVLQKTYDRVTMDAKKASLGKVYICSPFRGDTKKNIQTAHLACRFAWDSGYFPIAPHLYFPQFLCEDIEAERAAGLKYGMEAMWQCAQVWVFGDTISSGMRAEIDLAKDIGIEVVYYTESTEDDASC